MEAAANLHGRLSDGRLYRRQRHHLHREVTHPCAGLSSRLDLSRLSFWFAAFAQAAALHRAVDRTDGAQDMLRKVRAFWLPSPRCGLRCCRRPCWCRGEGRMDREFAPTRMLGLNP